MNEVFTEAPTNLGSSYTTSEAGSVDQAKQPADTENSPLDTEQEKMFDFSSARIHLQRIIEDWHTEVEDTEVRRKTRKVEIDTEGLRQKGDLDEDETIVPVRVIDQNIVREQPPYINYIKNSRRLCTFRSLSVPNQDSANIEQEFTEGMTYTGWENDHFKTLDGAQTHGWAAAEVVYDTSKPLNCGIEYIAHDKLFWPRSNENIQSAPRIIRAYDVTILTLKKWIREFGFDAAQVDLLIRARRDNQKENETVRIYKLFFKSNDVVQVGWFALTDGVMDWLKRPVKLFLGIKHKVQVMVNQEVPIGIDPLSGQPIMGTQQIPQETWEDSDISLYPVFILPYRETEEPKLVDHKGRVFLDEAKQEAQTAILSGFINGITRASNIFASPAGENGDGASLKELEDVKLVGGRILSQPMKYWAPPYPDAMILRTLQWMDVSNSQETNQVNFASMNREDSRKTAKEIGAAETQQQNLNSVQLTLFSTHIRAVYAFAWLIVQSQALQEVIQFLQIDVSQQQQQIPGQPPAPPQYKNNLDVIGQVWEVRAAGDVDVIQKNELEQKMQQDWPVIQNTALKDRFLADYVKLRYPAQGDQYSQILMQTSMMQQLQSMVARMGVIMQGMVQEHPEMIQNLPAQQQAEVAQLMQEANQMSGQNVTQQAK